MSDRRQFLRLTALAGAAVCASCGAPTHPTATAGAAAVTCPDIIAGTITDQTGPASFTDAATLGRDGADFQYQMPALLSTLGGLCQRHRTQMATDGTWVKRQAGEVWLNLVLGCFHCVPGQPGSTADMTNLTPVPLPPTPITLEIGAAVGVEAPAGSGDAYTVSATYVTSKGQQQSATAGTVQFTTCTETLVEATYTLTCKAGSFHGVVAAPFCQVC